MLTTISLVIIFFCFLFIVMCKRIHLKWFAKGLMCVGMIAIIAKLAAPKHADMGLDVLLVIMAYLTCHGTLIVYKRGTYK